MKNNQESLVTSKWLNDHLNDPDLVILDASVEKNKAGKTSDFENQFIKGARHFNLKTKFSDQNGTFPNTFPSKEQFDAECRALGINNSSKIVVYDHLGIYTSPRVWWMFKTMGHDQVHVLDGGLPDWINNGFETQQQLETPNVLGSFNAELQENQIKSTAFITANLAHESHVVIDVRSEGRFQGTAKEPREGLRSGHIPHSLNIPYGNVLEGIYYKNVDELKKIFHQSGIDNRPVVFSCGSGITACIVLLAFDLTMENPTSIYDGSWTEWASLTDADVS